MDLREYARRLPKVSLHCHLEGSVQAATVMDLARKHHTPVPGARTSDNLYLYDSFLDFLAVYAFVAGLVQDADDFHRVTYETLREAADHGVRYREMFWSPIAHLDAGVAYGTALEGILAGIADAGSDFGIQCRLIADIDRMQSPAVGLAMVETVLDNRAPEVVGIGLDYAEIGNPPEKHRPAFDLAGRSGLHRTAHTCEEPTPPSNVETVLDVLGCERIDHGYHVLDDEGITRRCVGEGVVFTCAPVSSCVLHFGPATPEHPIARMHAAGLRIVLDCDDPPMFQTEPSNDYAVAASDMGFAPADLGAVALNGIDGAWLDDDTKRSMRSQWRAEIDRLTDELRVSQSET